MQPADPLTRNARLAAVRATGLLNGAESPTLDRLTRLATRLVGAPIALVSLIDDTGQHFPGMTGFAGYHGATRGTPLSHSFCQHVVARAEPLIVTDATRDDRVRGNPAIVDMSVIAYAGVPLTTSDGETLGALCAIDSTPRAWTPAQIETLRDLAAAAMSELELQSALEVIREREARLQLLTDGVRDLVGGHLPDGTYTYVSPSSVEVLGYRPDELLGKNPLSFVHRDDRERMIVMATETPTVVTRQTHTYRGRHKDGSTIWLETVVRSMRSPEGRVVGFVSSTRDVSRRVVAEQRLEEARRGAERANQAKSDFLARMSHELRTPLNSIIGFTRQVLKNRQGALSARDLEFLSRVSQNGEHLLALINGILDLSKIEAGRVEVELAPTDLGALVHETVGLLEGQPRHADVALVADVPAGLAPVVTDAAKLKQVLINLAGNALKFTHAGSVALVVEADASGNATAIAVRDTGIGIAPERLDAVFEAFEQADRTTSRDYGGTGLGLAISRSLCTLLGATLTVSSEVGRGTAFRIGLTE